MWRTPIGRLRIIGLAEGVSFLVLLFIAMPLKYGADRPGAVQVVGWAHGLLFMIYLAAIVLAVTGQGLKLRMALLTAIGAVAPFGPFLIEPALRRADERQPVAAGQTG